MNYGIACTRRAGHPAQVTYKRFATARARDAWVKRDKNHYAIEPGDSFGPILLDHGLGYTDAFKPESIDWKTGLPLNGWARIEFQTCDLLCGRRAVWRHPCGGLRCATCPRPDR